MAPKKKAVKKAPSVGNKAIQVWVNVYPNGDNVYHPSLWSASNSVLKGGKIYTGLLREVVKRRGK